MTVQEAIDWACRWQDEAQHDPAKFEQAANVFSFALICLNLERHVALEKLSEAGSPAGAPLVQRVEWAIRNLRQKGHRNP